MTSELFFVSLAVLLLALAVLLVLCWTLRHSRNRNLTELKISAGRPLRILTIRTEPDHAQQMLDHLLDRVLLQVETEPESGEELREETEEEVQREADSGSDPEVSTAASHPSRPVNTFHDKLWKWITVATPPAAPPPPPPPPPPPADQDQTDDPCPQTSEASQYASLSSQGNSCNASWEVEKQDETQF